MDNRIKSRFQAFWVTGAIIGTVNAAIYLYVLSLPIVLTGDKKFETERMDRNPPEWISTTTVALNLPGLIATGVILNFPEPPPSTLVMFGLSQAIGTLFWACVGALVTKPTNPPKPDPDPPSESI